MDHIHVTSPHDTSCQATAPTDAPHPGWWLSLYFRLSSRARRLLAIACMATALLAHPLAGVYGQVSGQGHGGDSAALARTRGVLTAPAHESTELGRSPAPATAADPYSNPAVQDALHQLGLNAPAAAHSPAAPNSPSSPNAPSSLDNTPTGSQFQVNTYTTFDQDHPSVAVDADGDFVVVWHSYGAVTDTLGASIQGQLYNSAGTAVGSQFQVNTYTTNDQKDSSVAMDADGDFVVVWRSNGSYGSDASVFSIQGQRYNSVGTAQGTEFQVNTFTTSDQSYPSVAMDSGGDFVVGWQSYGSYGTDASGNSIQGQRYDSTGAAQGTEFQVNTLTTSEQVQPSVAVDSDGDFVVAWQSVGSYGTDIDAYSIQGQRYDSAGAAQGSQFQVNTYTTSVQKQPSVSLDADGDFVVVWQSLGSSGSDTFLYSIQGQRFNSAGTVQGSEFQVNNYTTDTQLSPSVALDSDGDFVVVWQSFGSNGGDNYYNSVQGRRFNSVGTALGVQFQVNNYTTNSQRYPSVALDADGDFVVAWRSYGSSFTDNGADYSVQAQRFRSTVRNTQTGNQFQVNSYTTGGQDGAVVSLDADGDFVVVWHSVGSPGDDTDSYSIQGQRFNSVGTALGVQFQVNNYTTGNQISPRVSLDADGDFVVAWTSSGSSETDTDSYSIQGQRYNSAGAAQGSQFQVNTYTTSYQRFPSVAMDADGDFVVVWDSYGSNYGDTDGFSVQGQRYNSVGAAQGSQFQVNSYTTSIQHYSSVALDADGDFVVAWTSIGSYGTDIDAYSIQGQRYNSVGAAQGSQFQVNSYTTNSQRYPSVALDADGDFVVVWNSYGSNYGDTASLSIQGQRFNAAGTPQGGQFQVNAYTTSQQRESTVSLDSDGDFVVVWDSYGSSGGDTSLASIQGQRYNSVGTAQGSQFQVNTYITDQQRRPALALDSDGAFVVAWQSNGVADPPSPALMLAAMAPGGPLAPDADADYGIAAARFQAQGGPLPTAVTLRAFGAEAVGGGWSAFLAGVGAVVSAWWWRVRGKPSAG